HYHVAVGQQHGVEREAFQAGAVPRGDLYPVPGDADEADEPFIPGHYRGLQRTAWAEGHLPLLFIDEVVKLPQVHVIGPKTVQRPVELVASGVPLSLARLRGKEHLVTVPGQPRANQLLRVSVRRGGVEVVDAVAHGCLDRPVGFGLSDARESRRPEDGSAAHVTCAAERCLLHTRLLNSAMTTSSCSTMRTTSSSGGSMNAGAPSIDDLIRRRFQS